MKKVLLFTFTLLLLIGCQSEKETPRQGPLSQIDEFDIFAFFATEENKQDLFKILIDCLKTIGTVQIIEKPFLLTSKKKSNVFFLSLMGDQSEKKGNIDLFGTVKIEANQFVTECCIWRFSLEKNRNDLPYPVIKNGLVSFKQEIRDTAVKNAEFSSKNIIRQLIESFAKEYCDSNSKNAKPVFQVYTG